MIRKIMMIKMMIKVMIMMGNQKDMMIASRLRLNLNLQPRKVVLITTNK